MAPPLARSFLLFCACAAGALGVAAARAQPQVPATFFGTASIDGEPVPDGTHVRAFIDGKDCTQLGENYRTTIRNGPVAEYVVQVVHESQEPGCGQPGRAVTFTIAGFPAGQGATWQAGVQNLNLNAGAGDPQPLPTITPAPTLEPGAAAATATEDARFTPRPTGDGPPPTDDDAGILITAGPRPDASRPQADGGQRDSDGDGFPVLGMIGIALGLLVVLGAALGYLLSRPRRGAV
jgi:hypothetical protein